MTLLYFDSCPNWRVTDAHLQALAQEDPQLRVTHHRVESQEEAERVGFHGSPSITIDGADPFGTGAEQVSFSCRIYPTPEGPGGSPTLEQLREVLRHD